MPPSPPGLIIVIPCHDEPDLLETFRSLWRCQRPGGGVQVITVINGSPEDPPPVRRRNQETFDLARAWIARHPDPLLTFELVHVPDLPPKHAGVGLARRIGMDQAAERFFQAGNRDGVIVCLDADCTVQPNYLHSLETHFRDHPGSPGCSIHFEHPFDTLDPRARLGIVSYELYLRVYRQGLRWSGFPHASHTVGSSMAVRAGSYRRQGGMNRRQAGEDFYFLHKIMPEGGFTDLTATTVHPAPRSSHLVPFGTGRAMGDWLAGTETCYRVYDPEVFRELKELFRMAGGLFDKAREAEIARLPEPIQGFLSEKAGLERLAAIRANTASPETFGKKFFEWFNGFLVLKYIHWATERFHPRVPVEQAAVTMLHWLCQPRPATTDAETLLTRFRQLDRQPAG